MSSQVQAHRTDGVPGIDTLAIEPGASAVIVPSTNDQIDRIFREGDNLVLVLVDGSMLVIQNFYTLDQLPNVTEFQEESGKVSIGLKISEAGEYIRHEKVDRGRIEEMLNGSRHLAELESESDQVATVAGLGEAARTPLTPSALDFSPDGESDWVLGLSVAPSTGKWLSVGSLALVAAVYASRDDAEEVAAGALVTGIDEDADGTLDIVEIDTERDGSTDLRVNIEDGRLEVWQDSITLDQRVVEQVRSDSQRVTTFETIESIDLGADRTANTLSVAKSALDALADSNGDGDFDSDDDDYSLAIRGTSGDVIEFQDGIVFQNDDEKIGLAADGTSGVNVYQDHRGAQYVVDEDVDATGAGYYDTPLAAIIGNVEDVNLVMLGATDVEERITENNLDHFRTLLEAFRDATTSSLDGPATRGLAGESEALANMIAPATAPSLSQFSERDLQKLSEYVNLYVQGAGDSSDVDMTASVIGSTMTMNVDTDLDGTSERVVKVEFFQTPGLTNLDAALVVQTIDRDGDGRVDRFAIDGTTGEAADGTVDLFEDFAYDASGRLETKSLDTNASDDGTYESIESYSYDGTSDKIVRTELDSNGDGTSERVDIDSDSDGNAERVETDIDSDGTAEIIELDTEDDGSIDITEHDEDGDGTPERVIYDTSADRTSVRTEHDPDDDGSIERTEHDADGDGNAERTEFDADGDGTAERVEHDYDDDGDIDRFAFDNDDDGNVDRFEDFEFDAGGRLSKVKTDENTSDDGIYERVETYGYAGASNQIIRTEQDTNANGTPDRILHDADGDGTPERIVHDADAGGSNVWIQFDPDDDGSFDRTEYDADGDGTPERIVHYANGAGTNLRTEHDLDDDGDIDLTEFDADGDGTPERIEHDADADGSNVRTDHDPDDDGDIDRTTHDSDGDGTFEQTEYDEDGDGNHERIEYDLDDNGIAERFAFDTNDDGTLDRIEKLETDASGRRTKLHIDENASNDGTYESIASYVYEGTSNRIIRTEIDSNTNGTPDRIEHDADGDGNSERIVHNADAGGTDLRTEYDVDDNGSIDRTEYDEDGDGTPERTVHDADADGSLVRFEYDSDDDGDIDRIERDADGDGTAERTEFDDDGDGTYEQIRFDQNDDGEVERIAYDVNDDGRIDRYEDFVFDASGRPSRKNVDEDASNNNIYELFETYTYDGSSSAIIRTDFDTDANGTVDRIENYDAQGAVTTAENYRYYRNGSLREKDVDENGDGLADRVEYFSENDGSLSRIDGLVHTDSQLTRRNIDSDASDDGVFERAEYYAYTVDGDLIRTEFDTDVDGLPDLIRNHYVLGSTKGASIEVLEYNSSGQVEKKYFDTDFSNGTNYEVIEVYEYDGEGLLVKTLRDTDASNDDTYEEVIEYGYKGLVRDFAEFDLDADERVDYKEQYDEFGMVVSTERFEYDVPGFVRIKSSDFDGNGEIDAIEYITGTDENLMEVTGYDVYFEYDENGNRITAYYDTDFSGTESFEMIETYEYDVRGNRIRTKFDTDASDDGTYERIETYAYDSESIWGDIHTRTEFDEDADGSVDSIIYYGINGDATSIETYVYATNTRTIKFADIENGGSDDPIYHRERTYTEHNNGTTSVEETEYRVSEGSRTRVIKRIDDDGNGIFDSVVNYDAEGNEVQPAVADMRMTVEFDSENSLSYTQVSRGTDGVIREILFPADDDYEYQPTAADGTAWQNVDTIALYNIDDVDLVFVGAEGSSGDVTLILTDEFIDAMMESRGSSDHVMIWGDEGDAVQMNFERYEMSVFQYDDTHVWFTVPDSSALIAIDGDMDWIDIPPIGSSDVGSFAGDAQLPI